MRKARAGLILCCLCIYHALSQSSTFGFSPDVGINFRNRSPISSTRSSMLALCSSASTNKGDTKTIRHFSAAWSKEAYVNEVDRTITGLLETSSMTVESTNLGTIETKAGQVFDLTSPREWLEWKEAQSLEGNRGGGGAYTVVRCDLSVSQLKVWGLNYHLQRLYDSISCIHPDVDEIAVQKAWDDCMMILQDLLQQSDKHFPPLQDAGEIYIVMLTFLWEATVDVAGGIRVIGHAFCSGVPSRPTDYVANQSGVVCSVALSSPTGQYGRGKAQLPQRYSNSPEAKLSSWCSQRRPLEDLFKVNDVGEVLMTRAIDEETVEVLEGLTSNIFVVLKDGTIRTPRSGVLLGYTRQIVTEIATSLGLVVEQMPIQLSDFSSGNIKEVFLTSSIRLIVPVKEIHVKGTNGSNEVQILWKGALDERSSSSSTWSRLYDNLLLQFCSPTTESQSANTNAWM